MKSLKRTKLFCEGVATAVVAHASAWVALVSIEKAIQICGHIVGALILHAIGR
jgi:hypothetical protein